MRDKITFEPNQRIHVTLDKSDSKEMPGRNGPQYMRVVDDDQRIMFCDPALELAIAESGAGAGDTIQIVQIGKGKAARFEVAIVSDPPGKQATRASEPAPANAPAAPQPAGEMLHRDAALLASSYVAAMQATAEAERYAASTGFRNITFSDKETITRLAMTVFIARSKEGR